MLKKTLIVLTLPLLFLLVVAASLCRGAPGSLPTKRDTPRRRRGYSPCDRHSSKDDRGERKRHDGSRS